MRWPWRPYFGFLSAGRTKSFLEEVVGPSGRNTGGSDYKHRVFMERRECCLLSWVVISR